MPRVSIRNGIEKTGGVESLLRPLPVSVLLYEAIAQRELLGDVVCSGV